MTIFPMLRLAGMLRRIAKALEERNRIERERMDRESPAPRPSRHFDISRPTVEHWNERHGGKG